MLQQQIRKSVYWNGPYCIYIDGTKYVGNGAICLSTAARHQTYHQDKIYAI